MRSQDCVHAAKGMTRGEASYLSNLGPSAVVPGPIPFKPLGNPPFKASATELKVARD